MYGGIQIPQQSSTQYLSHLGDLHFYLSLQKQQCAVVGFHHSSDKSIEMLCSVAHGVGDGLLKIHHLSQPEQQPEAEKHDSLFAH